jgi:hypothetical protein
MSIQGITPNVYAGSATPGVNQTRQNLRKLENGLATNNLQEAQQAYNSLQATAPTGNGSGAQAFHLLGQDLQTGDLNGARSELAKLVQSVQHQHQVRADIGKLQAGLATNNLQGARQALSALQGIVGQRPELQPLAQALQSGDLAGARSAFTTLIQDVKSEIGGSTPPPPSSAVNVTA